MNAFRACRSKGTDAPRPGALLLMAISPLLTAFDRRLPALRGHPVACLRSRRGCILVVCAALPAIGSSGIRMQLASASSGTVGPPTLSSAFFLPAWLPPLRGLYSRLPRASRPAVLARGCARARVRGVCVRGDSSSGGPHIPLLFMARHTPFHESASHLTS